MQTQPYPTATAVSPRSEAREQIWSYLAEAPSALSQPALQARVVAQGKLLALNSGGAYPISVTVIHRITDMRKLLHLLFCAMTFCASSAPTRTVSAAESRPQPVGLQSAHFEDETRRNWRDSGNRPLETLIWYPAVAGSKEIESEIAIFKAGRYAKGAAIAASPAKLPLIVLSHGTGGVAMGMGWLGETLAANGYIVAAVNHHGNTGAEPNPPLQGTLVWWDRPQDLTVLINKLLADPNFGPRIDASRIGAAGFSIGGYTALASVGARLSQVQWRKFCTDVATSSSCKLPPEVADKYSPAEAERLQTHDPRILKAMSHMGDTYADPRIRAAFAIAPVVGVAMTRDSLAQIKVPVRIVVGAEDDQAIPRYNAQPIASTIPGAKLDILPQVTHYTFLPVCNERGSTYAKAICTSPAGVDRAAIHLRVGASAVGFFQQALGN